MDASTLSQQLNRFLARTPNAQVGVHAPMIGLDYRSGPEEPFHAASVGKLVTTTLVAQLVDSGTLTWRTRLADLLDATELQGLFREPREVTLEHVVTHTSGVADYFEGKVSSGLPVVKEAIDQPDRRWSPAELLAVSRERQRPVGGVGERFSYSDTGFVLLGRALEEVVGMPYEQQVQERLAQPLGLASLFLPYRTNPSAGSTVIAPLAVNGRELSSAASLTCDWAGGGIAATVDDWLSFGGALFGGALVSGRTMEFLTRPRNRFRAGLDYGAGTMTVKFEGFVPWARGWPRLVGHLGITAAHLWHDPESQTSIVINLGSTRAMTRSFRVLFKVVELLRKVPAG